MIRDDAAPLVAGTSKPCQVHRGHHPTSHVNEQHHVWPRAAGGPDIPDNRVIICATGHNSTHQLLSMWLKASGDPGWDVRRHYSRGEQQLAQLGYERIKRQEM